MKLKMLKLHKYLFMRFLVLVSKLYLNFNKEKWEQ